MPVFYTCDMCGEIKSEHMLKSVSVDFAPDDNLRDLSRYTQYQACTSCRAKVAKMFVNSTVSRYNISVKSND